MIRCIAIFQYKVYRTVVDLTVLVYIIIPPIIALILYLRHVWINSPDYIFSIPSWLLAIVIYIVISIGQHRSFYEYGDQLYLIQNRQWFSKLKRYGMMYSALTHIVTNSLFFAVTLPILYLGFDYSVEFIISLFFFCNLTMSFHALLKRKIYTTTRPFLKAVNYVGLFACTLFLCVTVIIIENPVLTLAIAISQLIGLIIIAVKPQVSYAKHINAFVSYDIVMRYRYLKLLLSVGE